MADPVLGELQLLADFRAEHERERRLTPKDKHRIVATARTLLADYYVHLPMKRALHGIDPLQALRILDDRCEPLTDRAFHDEMLAIFADLQDRHTIYWVPEPYRDLAAALPFRVQCIDRAAETPRYLVTVLTEAWVEDEQHTGVPFVPGVEITGWNGMAADRAVRLNARWQAGTHEDARLARGVARLTDRALTFSPLPDEDWVIVDYRDADGGPGSIRLRWRVYRPPEAPGSTDRRDTRGRAPVTLGVDRHGEAVRRAQKTRFYPEAMARERGARTDLRVPVESSFPDNLDFRLINRGDRRYGHLRLYSFEVEAETEFVYEVRRLLTRARPDAGLIIDVRGNPGGRIAAAERLLQLFTPSRVHPAGVQFLTTAGTQKLARRPEFSEWKPSLERSSRTGEDLSDALPLEPGHDRACNAIGQVYHGPVVLVMDALSYSATDGFAAGFQDHGLGPVIGVDRSTGGGGGNAWNLSAIEHLAGHAFALPLDVTFDIALRRNVRVGARSGTPIEELGVTRDLEYQLTRDDVLGDNHDLVAFAIDTLAQRPSYRLDVTLTFEDGTVALDLDSAGLDSLDVYLDGRPALIRAPLTDGPNPLDLPADPGASHLLELYGYAGIDLVAARRERFGTGRATAVGVRITPVSTMTPTTKR
ncbi:S41 family peptidase [Solirubrobacter ginsenosidimutans]|uniref:S41 family peptidase n=1 Tax=Solirubrobacter ginsenosidimutans TaxID=490573 RepID=A0A9X3MNC2_9ACTN|nr:S41 family peptidase [Solirubrobacter ginsenosidimutans]MDA0159771.1 S41 family peptidase [Solirubrobacter ginsenosidimutans]